MTEGYEKYLLENASRIFSHLRGEDPRRTAERIFEKYGSLEMAFCSPYSELEESFGKQTAHYIKILAEVTSRRITDGFEFGSVYSESAVSEYLKGLCLSAEQERVYVLFLDDEKRVLGCKMISEGTVNSSDIFVRKIIENAIEYSSHRIILAHCSR